MSERVQRVQRISLIAAGVLAPFTAVSGCLTLFLGFIAIVTITLATAMLTALTAAGLAALAVYLRRCLQKEHEETRRLAAELASKQEKTTAVHVAALGETLTALMIDMVEGHRQEVHEARDAARLAGRGYQGPSSGGHLRAMK